MNLLNFYNLHLLKKLFSNLMVFLYSLFEYKKNSFFSLHFVFAVLKSRNILLIKKVMKAKRNEIVKNYTPSHDEQYMNKKQLEYFKEVLETWRLQTQHNLSEVEKRLSELNASDERDEMDRAFIETEVAITINKISALQNLLNEIDISLTDIQKGTYGYCKKSGKEIGIKRLMAKPTSRFAIKAQEDTEKQAKTKVIEDDDLQSSTNEDLEEVNA